MSRRTRRDALLTVAELYHTRQSVSTAEIVRRQYATPILDALGQLVTDANALTRAQPVQLQHRKRLGEVLGVVAPQQAVVLLGWEVKNVVRPSQDNWEKGNGSSILLLQTGYFAMRGDYPAEAASTGEQWPVLAEHFHPVTKTTAIDHAAVHDYLVDLLRPLESGQSA